jgi:DNA modification methylase
MTDFALNKIICGDCREILKTLPDDYVDCVITSPPYFRQRDYGSGGIGNETSAEEYLANLIEIFRHCVRATKKRELSFSTWATNASTGICFSFPIASPSKRDS